MRRHALDVVKLISYNYNVSVYVMYVLSNAILLTQRH